jgi:hypothetical protein
VARPTAPAPEEPRASPGPVTREHLQHRVSRDARRQPSQGPAIIAENSS